MILCGGAGARLWPASRPGRSKPFVPLTGERSPFRAALDRARAVATGEILVVGGVSDAARIGREADEAGVVARIVLEPSPRGTTAAIAAAAAWARRGPGDVILAIMPADHEISDDRAFAAGLRAAAAVAEAGAIVTLGLRPAAASDAVGYILPGAAENGALAISGFVEKPAAERAAGLIRDGALWNAGVFVASADALAGELSRWAPAVAAAVEAGLETATVSGACVSLGPAFDAAPAVAFDRAIMEKTTRGAVVPVDFAWSDVGAWDAVLAASPRDAGGSSLTGDVHARDVRQVLVRAAPGIRVAVAGVERLAVVAEADAVLVCGLDAAQSVRVFAGARPPPKFADLASAATALDSWLSTAALPLWATVGVDESSGLFREALTWKGEPQDPRCRTRVQARQAFVFAAAARDRRPGPWDAVARRAFDAFRRRAAGPDGLFATVLSPDGRITDPEARLYEHGFVLLALAALGDEAQARRVRGALDRFRHAAGGFREAGDAPFQANAHMHLLEAALAWEAIDPAPMWRDLADEIVTLALERFVTAETGALLEFFAADWSPLSGDAAVVEPGHQFEWAWLLADWGRRRGDPRGEATAARLYEAGRRGVDAGRGVAVNALTPRLDVRDPAARLWPQTERLKAALSLGAEDDALEAANAVAAFLDTPVRGVWRERMYADGAFVEEPSPATSLYHLYLGIRELRRFAPEAC
ncbi:AGE family epimerase/isomerase [Phenylobacterium sp.]|uniref:AGE family epimerase/isomerase n=1 Tax=Phenylobacterium sp. TaxID=1871053 RepID=UPI00301CA8FB